MSRRPRTRRRPRDREPESMREFFFADGDPRRPRQELVTRQQLWNTLEWYDRQVRRPRTWLRRLWRAVTRKPAWNPLGWLEIERLKKEREEG